MAQVYSKMGRLQNSYFHLCKLWESKSCILQKMRARRGLILQMWSWVPEGGTDLPSWWESKDETQVNAINYEANKYINVNTQDADLGAARKSNLKPTLEDVTVNDSKLRNCSPWESRYRQSIRSYCCYFWWWKCKRFSIESHRIGWDIQNHVTFSPNLLWPLPTRAIWNWQNTNQSGRQRMVKHLNPRSLHIHVAWPFRALVFLSCIPRGK